MINKEIKIFFEPIKNQKILTIMFIIFSAFISFFLVYSIEIIKKITKAIELKELNKLYYLLYLFIAFILFYQIIRWYGKDFFPHYKKNAKNFLQEKYIKKFILFDNNSYEKIGTGKFIALIEKGIESWSSLLTEFFYFGGQLIFSYIFIIIYIFSIAGYYTLILIFIMFILLYITKIVNKKAIEARSHMLDYSNFYTKNLVKIIMSKFEILQNNKINTEINELKYLTNKEFIYFKKRIFWLEVNFGINRLFNNFFKVGAIFLVGIGVIKGIYDFSDFLAIITVLTIFDSNISRAVEYYKNFTKQYVKVDKLLELYKNIPSVKNYGEGNKFKFKKGNFEIKQLCFSYSQKEIFNNFNLKIKSGKKTAIIGKSGSGKTTLIKLLSGFLNFNSGEILVDGQKLSKLDLKTYYKHIGYLTQEASVFDGTILENLSYGNINKLKKSQIKEALRLAQANFVFDFVGGLDTQIGERGIRLSGGQRQRLAIAKIFLKNPEIIILDEPTSALDSFSEEKVVKAINNLFKDRTVIIIAHRLQTVKEADSIIVLDKFSVIEIGTHNELLKAGKYYKKMVSLQSGLLLDL